MSDSDEQRRERASKLHAAIEAHLDGLDFHGILGDWLLIGSVVRIDESGDPNGEYFTAMSGGSMLQHHALGLLAKAEDVLVNPDETD